MTIEYIIRKIIETENNITIDRLMRELLTQNIDSYYKTTNILGIDGDFITSPEISQLFGETIGFWVYEQWKKLGCPKNINIVELGGGNGLLIRDLLRVAKLVPEFYSSLSVEIVEINPYFINEQMNIISQYDVNFKILSNINQIKHMNSIFIANEFFDALPIKQYINSKNTWHEIILTTDPTDSKITFDKREVRNLLQESFARDHPNASDGAIIEESYESIDIVTFMCNHLLKYSGAGLIIDYGYYIDPNARTSHQYSSTIQAIKNHKYHSILNSLGSADISAHVNFYALEEIIKRYNIKSNFTSQKYFLIDNGLLIRSENLKKSLKNDEKIIVDKQVNKLISHFEMGELFKTLTFFKLVN